MIFFLENGTFHPDFAYFWSILLNYSSKYIIMKRFTLLLSVLVFLGAWNGNAQNIAYQEGFEGTPAVTTGGTQNWAVNTAFYNTGVKSYSAHIINAGDSSAMTTNSFSTVGNSNVMLEFSHICKIEFFDAGEVYVSADNGVTWTKLTGNQYLGSGGFGVATGDKFSATTYTTWMPGNPSPPQNTWWQTELFDISALAANAAQVKVRFVLRDMNNQTQFENWGWVVDDIKVSTAVSELQPPTITMLTPIIQDTVYTTGPYDILATITDTSGVAVAKVVYDVNGGTPDTLTMVNTTGNTYMATIPSFTYTNKVNYYVFAIDSTVSANKGQTSAYWFYIKKGLGAGNNVALTAVSTHSGGGATSYGPQNYNDDVIPATPSTLPWGWVSTNGWIEYTWVNPTTFNKIKFWKADRPMTSCTVQKWDGSTYVNIHSYSGSTSEDSIMFTAPHTTTKLRFNTVAGSSNPNHREIQVFAPLATVPLDYDAGVSHFVEPAATIYTTSAIPVKVRIKNFSVDTLTKVSVGWSVDGVAQTPYLWTGTLFEDQVSSILTIGNYAFPVGGHTIKVWTSMPNDSLDQQLTNDTMQNSILVCAGQLSGTYTVGPSGDYPSPQTALSAMLQCGIAGPVVFNIAPGTYPGQMTIPDIPGTSATNNIVFQSANGDSLSVIITFAATGDNWTVRFNGAKYVSFKKLTIEATGLTLGRVVEFTGGAAYNEVSNCNIVMPAVTSSSYAGFYSYTTHSDNYNIIRNNRITGGYYGMYIYGSSTMKKIGNIIEGNVVENFYYYGIYTYYNDSVLIKGNSVLNPNALTTNYAIYAAYASNGSKIQNNIIRINGPASGCYGVYTSSGLNGLEISGNDIEITNLSTIYAIYSSGNDNGLKITGNRMVCNTTSTCYPLYITSCDGTSVDSLLVSNNMITQLGGTSNTVYGLYLNTCTYINIYNNSIAIYGSGTATRGIYQTGGSAYSFINNNIGNFSGGYTMYIATTAGVGAMNYNNYYTTGANLGYWGANQANLTAWKTASGKDANAVSVDPGYLAQTDLHVNNPSLNAAAIPLLSVPTDIDGNLRDTLTPDIGADEFILIANDAGVVALVSPVIACPGDTSAIMVKIKNFGTDSLKTFTVNWSVNGVLQTPVNIQDTILFNATKDLTIGSYVFNIGQLYDLKFWTTSPNGLLDGNPLNDTLLKTGFSTALQGGTYTIGGTGADFPSFTAAVNQLNSGGICGPVIFSVASGTYNEQISINPVPGSSAVNTITFVSAAGDSTAVILTANAPAGNYVVRLNGATYIKFSKMSIVATHASQGYGVVLTNGSSYNEFSNCVIQVPAGTASSAAPVYSTSGAIMEQYNKILNNRLLNGYYGVYLYGSSSTVLEKGNVIEGNIISDFYYYGVYGYYSDSLQINNNTMVNGSTSGTVYGAYLYYNDYPRFKNNDLTIAGTSTSYGLYTSYGDYGIYTGNNVKMSGASTNYGLDIYYANSGSSSTNLTLVANNFVSQTAASTGTIYAIYSYYSNYVNYYHNSVNVTQVATPSNSYAFYLSGGSAQYLQNNIFSNPAGGYAAYVATTTAIAISNYNNFFSTGTNLGYWGANVTSLAAWKTLSGKDANSVSVYPKFLSNNNLHIKNNIDINDKGMPIATITDDIDGELRSTTTPDIGADEFTPPANEVEVVGLYTYGKLSKQVSLPHQVNVVVENSGSSDQVNYPVTLTIAGANAITNTHVIDTLKTGQRVSLFFPALPATMNLGYQTVTVTLPTDDDTTNNVRIYHQMVTDTIISWADTLPSTQSVGYNTAGGLLLAKYPLNGLKSIDMIKARIVGSTTVGKTLYGVVVTKTGNIIATSAQKTIATGDLNTMVEFPITNVSSATISNDTILVGIAQVANAAGYNPLGCQTEFPVRPETFYGSAITGGALTEITQNGRFMIEFEVTDPPTRDIVAVGFQSPQSGCALGNETIKLEVKNLGSDTIQPPVVLTMGYRIAGTSVLVTETVTNTILPGATYLHTFANTLNMAAPVTDSTYDFYGFATLSGDPYQQNDTTALYQVESKQTPLPPVVTTPVNIAYGAQATLTAQSPMPVEWYATDTSTVKLDTGYTYITQPLFDTTTFWAQAGSAMGAPVSLYTGTQSSNYAAAQTRGFHFTAPVNMIITELMVPNTVTAGNQYIQVVKFSGYPVVYPNGSPFTTLAMITNAPFNVPQPVNIVIQAGDEIGIIGACNSSGTTMNNSYGSPQVASSIGGIPVVLTRLVYQSPLVSGPAASGTIGLEVSSNIARIDVTYVVGGVGCPSVRVPVVVNTAMPPPVDAGAGSIISPGPSVTSNTLTPVEVTVKNYGTSNLTSAQINYSVDGVLKTPYALTGINLPYNGVSSPVILGNESYPGGVHTIKVWTSLPNGIADTVNTNDTITHTFNACLNGTYTLGTAASDFPTFTDALNALVNTGICGHVIFNVANGTYATQLNITAIPGMGPNATVTFQSAANDSTQVSLQYNASSTTDNFVVRLTGASWFRFRKMTIRSSPTATYSRGFELLSNSSNNIIENCLIIGNPVSSSYANGVYIYTGCEYNQVLNNNIQGSYQAIYVYGSSSTSKSKGNIVAGNRLTGFYLYGIYSYYQDSAVISGNYLATAVNTYSYGIYTGYNDRSQVLSNDVQLSNSSYGYCLYASYFNAASGTPGLIANNFLSKQNGTGTTYGMYLTTCTDVRVVFNSIHIADQSTASRGIYQTSGGAHKYLNNNIMMQGGGVVYYIAASTAIDSTDYNNFFSTASTLAYWGGNVADLAALKIVSGKETNSISVNPSYPSVFNLHTSEVSLNAAAKPLGYVTTDFDGQPRSATAPDIGADEFDPLNNDAGLVAITAPNSPVTVGLNPVVVTIKNGGLLTMTSAQVNWQVNGVLQTPYSWTGSLLTNTTQANVTIGSYNFAAGPADLKVWVSLPNGQPDMFPYNDTLTKNLVACASALKGIYTIGATGADFSSFASAINGLISCGVDSAVIFNVAPGTYNEKIIMGYVPGVSAANTITFQSATGDSTSVIITSAVGDATYPGTVNLSGASYITFKSLTINATGTTNAYGVNIMNGSLYNRITNCVVTSPAISTSTIRSISITGGTLNHYNDVINCKVQGGYYGIYVYGSGSTSWIKGNVISGNEVSGTYYYPIYAYYTDSVQIVNNRVFGPGYDYNYGISFYYGNNAYRITGNRVEITTNSSSASYGIRDYYCNYYSYNANPSGYGIVANNFVSILGGSGTNYGLYAYYSNGTEYVFNTFNITGTGASGRALYQYNTASNSMGQKFYNNIFVNTGGGYAAYFNTPAQVVASDNNNYYTNTANFVYWGGNMANLAALQAVSAKDSNSVSVDPMFITPSNLHVMSPALNAAGKPYPAIMVDIDGEPRSTTAPDIGADEFAPNAKDAAMHAFISPSMSYGPAGSPFNIEVQFRNLGADTISAMDLGYIIGTGTPVTYAWSGTLAPNALGTYMFAAPVNLTAGTHPIKVYVDLATDADHTNDTLLMNYVVMPVVTPGWSDNFDQTSNYWATPGTLWQRGIPTATTINNAHSIPNVWATNLSGQYPNNANEFLISPYFDFSSLSGIDTAYIEFWHWVDVQANSDYCQVQYSKDSGSTWVNLGFYQDPYGTNWYNVVQNGVHFFSSTNTGWVNSKYKLDPNTFNQNNLVQFRFRFYSNASLNTYDGWAIDDFRVALPTVPNDVGITMINHPVNDTAAGSQVNVDVTIKNFGTNAQVMIPLVLKLNGVNVSTETWTGSLAGGASTTYAFVLPLTIPGTAYDICAATQLPGDAFPANDQSCKNYNALPAYHDVGVSMILAPWTDSLGQICFYEPATHPWYKKDMIVRIRNFGQNTQTSIPVKYTFLNGGLVMTGTWTGNMLSGDSADYLLPDQFPPNLGAQQVCVETNLTGDVMISNNKACKTYIGVLCIGADELDRNGFAVGQNIPNPASGNTLIPFMIPESGEVQILISDLPGKVMYREVLQKPAGEHTFELNVNHLSQGVYYYTLEYMGQRITRKMVVRK